MDFNGNAVSGSAAEIEELENKTQNMDPVSSGNTNFNGNLTVNGAPVVSGSVGNFDQTYSQTIVDLGSPIMTTTVGGQEFVIQNGTLSDANAVFAIADIAGNKNFNVLGSGKIDNTGGVLHKLAAGESFTITDSLAITEYLKVDEATKVITVDNDAGAFQEFSGNSINTESLVLHKLPSSGTFKVTNFSNTFDYFKVDDAIGLITMQVSAQTRAIRPETDDTFDLGTAAGPKRWKDIYMSGTLGDGSLNSIAFGLGLMTITTNGLTLDTNVTCLGQINFTGNGTQQWTEGPILGRQLCGGTISF
jgi:hypothetical protein